MDVDADVDVDADADVDDNAAMRLGSTARTIGATATATAVDRVDCCVVLYRWVAILSLPTGRYKTA